MKINIKQHISDFNLWKSSSFWRVISLLIIIGLFFTITIHPSPSNDYRMTDFNDNCTSDNRMTNLNSQLLSNPSEWIICGPTSWEDLKTYLPEAKMAGITVSVLLLPPFQSTQNCTEGAYSDPFGNDYILWAQEIATLSLRYSNLIEFGIYDLRENLNLGYLGQTYLDSIISECKSINPRLQFISPNKNFYVDRDASGTGDGTSWVNAADKLLSLPWSDIFGGDTVYVSGGTDSTTYTPSLINEKRYNFQVTVTKSWEPGHNGDVYFVNPNNTLGYALRLDRCKNIKVTGLYFRTLASVDDSLTNNKIIALNYNKDVIIDNCNIVSNGIGNCMYLYRDTSTVITNNHIEVTNNSYSSAADGIHIDGSTNENSYTITGNTIISDADVSSYSHKDCIHIAGVGGVSRPTTIIANNLLLATSGDDYYNTGINITGSYSAKYLIYNNVIAQYNRGVGGINLVGGASGATTLEIFNNTVLVSGDGATLELEDLDTLIVKNNIFMVDGDVSALNIIFPTDSASGYGALTYKDINYNIYDGLGSAKFSVGSETTTRNFTQWQALGHDANSIEDSVEFASKWGSTINSYKLKTGSPGLAAGTNISGTYSFLATDINVVTRSDWDLGAVESR